MPDPLILIDPVQQNDFTARAIAFPNDPLPGNLVDGEFAHIRAILGVAVNILQSITSPDGLSIGQVIGLDQLTPGALDALAQTVTDAVASDTANAQGAAVEATAQKNEATVQADTATAAATAAVAALTVIQNAQAATVEAISALTPAAQESADDAADSASAAVTAKEAAEVASSATIGLTELAGAWAEHMPGTIPPDVLAAMAITGDHWSARWWANQAAQIVSAVTDLANNAVDLTTAFNKLYLGPKDEDPSFDNEGQPLLVGALYFNELSSEMRVWSGTVWTDASGTGGFVTAGSNLGGGARTFKDIVTGAMNFRTITVNGGLGVTETANEIQLTINSVAWSKIATTPTTLAGYGIADAYTKAQVDTELDAADAAIGARATITYVNSELDAVDAAIATKADATATTSALSTLTTNVGNRVVRTSATGAAIIPAGTTAQRDGAPAPGYFRYNSTLGVFEGWTGAAWVPISPQDLAPYMVRASNLSDLGNVDTALNNLGFGAFGKTLRAAVDAPAGRASLGQSWVTIFDQTVSGAAAGVFDVNLQGYTNLRWRMDFLFNAAVAADSGFGVRNSIDGGATYRAAGSDYLYVISYSDITLGYDVASQSLNGLGTLSNTFSKTAGATVPILMSGNIFAGSAARRFAMDNRFYGDGPASARLAAAHTRSQVNGKSTHVRFMSDVGYNSFDIGTRLIVEAAA